MNFFTTIIKILDTYHSLFLHGIFITILLAVVGTIVGLVLGIIVAMYRTIPLNTIKNSFFIKLYLVGRILTTCYIELFRSTPMMVQAMVIYFGLASMGYKSNVLVAGLIIITINTGAYMAEIVRSGIISIDPGQYEASHSVGLTHWQTMIGIIMPQAIRNILPTIGNEFIINMKDSCVLSIIGLSEVFYSAQTVAGATFETFPAFSIACVIYLVLTLITTQIINFVEKRMHGSDTYELLSVNKGGNV